MATVTGSPSPSIRMPAILAPRHSMSFGHLSARLVARLGASAAAASWTARPATKASCGAAAAGAGSVSSRLAWRLPGGDIQERPRRPRPAVCCAAAIHNGPRSPARARRSASALVESTLSRTTGVSPAQTGPPGILEQRFRGNAGGVDQQGRIDEEQQHGEAAYAEHGAQFTGHRVESLRRLVEI